MPPTAMTLPVLIILHQEQSTPGRVGYALRDRGYPLDIRRPRFGDPLPATMAEHAGVVIFGGPQSANDPDDFIKAEIDFIGVPLRENKPYLGICLGAQMLAKHLGQRVYTHPEGKAEVGYYPIRPTAAGRAICDWPDHMYQWHREGFDLPRGCELLAEGDIFRTQAFRAGAGYAIQFHAEVTHAMMCRWTTRGAARMELPCAKKRAEHFADRPVYDHGIRAWLSDFLDHWLTQGAQRHLAAAE
jgi:GMP synthase (glutamine-hydrolysing)